MSHIAVIDFETTGLSPAMGDRATEVAIVLMENGQIVDRFQSLMNAGRYIPSFIESLTGISNAMIAAAPAAEKVMLEANRFVGNTPMVAHNASFDRRFWEAELCRVGERAIQPFVCTMLVARRLYPQAPSHKLGVLIDYHRLPKAGRAHRAMADAEMAASLLGQIQNDLRSRHRVGKPDHALLMNLQRCAKPAIPALMARHADV
ncbi:MULTISPECIES: PolC-type DNA polymerase III [unclassified Polaromonas]|uniref:3'-5' exonuclease n=1 Tax=unclassified Polaromonas TaxID=2638319 RepID=UPI000F09A318|nr:MULTISPECIES: 3'-5' exonuclease [unclassified Polaromonas]AYQ27748.1 3'-5' exonuclease [Polaromonas sp. SP1]QGJ17398.1 3'-5' exonuclease [Polaromonas sp. Pch-P]